MDTVTVIRVATGLVILGLVVLAFLLAMRRSRRAKKLGTELRGVDGWLAWICICLIAGAPLFAMKVIAANLQNPLVVILELVLASFSVYTGFAVWRIKPNALKLVKAYFLVILGISCLEILGSLLAAHSLRPYAAAKGMVAATGGLVSVAILWLYFKKSKRVKATFGYNLGEPRSPASSPAPEGHAAETQASPTVAAAQYQTLLNVALPSPSADNLEQKSHMQPDQHEPSGITRWKRIVLVGAGFGAGFALMAALVGGAVLWYVNRPKPPRPWDNKNFRASFASLSVGTDSDNVVVTFAYDLENTTKFDYTIRHASSVQIAAKMENSGSLASISNLDYARDITFIPTLIPARQKARFTFHIAYDYTDSFPEKSRNDLKKLSEFLYYRLKDIDGFVFLDQANRYEVNLPSGWKGIKP